ncbi:MAG: 4Fe-4S binding protein [Bacteroidales bacterium]|jgi:ferredoxin|nr:4Fe-4S binding protein [Bacteroidales bacterium]
MQAYLKPARIVISIATLLVVGFLFLDFGDTVPAAWFRKILWLQFIPSLFGFLNTLKDGLSLSVFGFAVVLLLTLLFGRVYCSYLCPLGVFQDVICWFSKKIRKKKRYRFTPPKTWLRYGILVVVCLSLLSGSIYLVNVLDPYSNFGRFFTDFFRPLYVLGNNLLVQLLQSLGSYALYPVKVVSANPYALIVPAAMLVLVVWCAIRKGRLYCNAICPVGTLLGLIACVSLFKIRINKTTCTQCGKCTFACKSHCIDIKQQQIDSSRCVGCANCLKSCDKNSIGYALASANKPKKVVPDKSKRRFLFGSILFMGALGGLSVKSMAISRKDEDETPKEEHHTGFEEAVKTHQVSPPGSKGIRHFTGSCTACHLCVSACPTGVLKPSLFEWGFFGMGQPYMDYHSSFCNYECVKCSEVCPNKAILPLAESAAPELKEAAEKDAQQSFETQFSRTANLSDAGDYALMQSMIQRNIKVRTQIGTVRFIRNNCIVYSEETSCGSCSEHCPTKAVRMVPYKGELTIPQIDTDICVGCGACEYACPVTPNKAILVDGCKEHGIAQKPDDEAVEEKPLTDFAF